MLPLLIIYIAEYTINQGVGPTLLFPLSSLPFSEYREDYLSTIPSTRRESSSPAPPPPSSASTPSTSPLSAKCSTSLSSLPTPCTTTSQTYTLSLPSSSGRAPSAAWSTSARSPRSPRSGRVTRGSSRWAPSPSAIREGYASRAYSASDWKCGSVAGRWQGGEIIV